MTEQPGPGAEGEERFHAPVDAIEDEPSRTSSGIEDEIDEHELRRLTELNPDDFE